MTENEAKKKWCLNTRFTSNIKGIHTNKNIERTMGHNHDNCIASDCMAWRWFHVMDECNNFKKISKEDGYCGLAGF